MFVFDGFGWVLTDEESLSNPVWCVCNPAHARRAPSLLRVNVLSICPWSHR